MFASLSVAGLVRGDHADPPGVADRAEYDGGTAAAIVRRPSGGYLLGGVVDRETVRVVATTETGQPRTRRTIDVPSAVDEQSGVALAATSEGYVVGSGPWIALLDGELGVRTKTVSPEVLGPGNTEILTTDAGVVVAYESVYPSGARVDVDAYDETGTHRWHRRIGDDSFRRLGFLVRDGDGVLVGGDEGGTLWTARLSPEGDRRAFTRYADVSVSRLPAAARLSDGVAAFDPPTLTRLDETGEVVAQRSYDQFERSAARLARLPDGGLLAATSRTVGAFDPDGSPQWIRSYHSGGTGGVDGVATADSAFAVVGSDRDSGWFTRFSPAVSPTPSATPSPTASATPSPTPTESRTPTSSEPQTSVSTPGFGVGLGLGAAGAVSGWLYRRVRGSSEDR